MIFQEVSSQIKETINAHQSRGKDTQQERYVSEQRDRSLNTAYIKLDIQTNKSTVLHNVYIPVACSEPYTSWSAEEGNRARLGRAAAPCPPGSTRAEEGMVAKTGLQETPRAAGSTGRERKKNRSAMLVSVTDKCYGDNYNQLHDILLYKTIATQVQDCIKHNNLYMEPF